MRWLTRLRDGAVERGAVERGAGERGAAAVLVAVLLGSGVLLGMAALTVDVGQVYAERRQLQNGADAAALAVAAACATSASCDTSTGGLARSMANANADDGTTTVASVCGSGNASLPACSGGAATLLTGCPAAPANARGWVQVGTLTTTTGGSTLLPPAFARALPGNRGYAGTAVRACAQAGWGPPAGLDGVVPLILSECEWYAATSDGRAFAGRPPYPPFPAGEVALLLHSTTERGGCPSSGGAYADLPGGFGWLASGVDCQVSVSEAGLVGADPGVAASTCSDVVSAKVGSVLYLPVFSQAWGSGSGGTYRISGFAAFYLSGYNLPGAHPSRVASPSGGHLCRGSDKCVYGWFTQGLVPRSGAIGHGRPMGATVVAMTG